MKPGKFDKVSLLLARTASAVGETLGEDLPAEICFLLFLVHDQGGGKVSMVTASTLSHASQVKLVRGWLEAAERTGD